MITVEVYSYESGIRCIDKIQYPSIDAWERDHMLKKLAGTWVGHKIYKMPIADFNKLSETERNNSDCVAKFDKDAFLGHKGEEE